jgi:hypothetical protein
MGKVDVYTPEEIARRTSELEAANHKDHVKFVVGAIVVTLLIVGGAFLALADL